MVREDALARLSIRLTHLFGDDNPELARLLKNLRQLIKGDGSGEELNSLSDQLARSMIVKDEPELVSFKLTVASDNYISDFVKAIKALPVGSAHQLQLDELTKQLMNSSELEVQSLLDVFKILHVAISESPSQKPSKSVLGWFDKKNIKANEQWNTFLDKSTKLLSKILTHIDVFNGDSSDTKWLKDELEQSTSVDSLQLVLDEVVILLTEISNKVNSERATTQSFLDSLRGKLHSIEEVIFSVIADGDESMERAENLGKQVRVDVEVMGKAAEQDDIAVLKEAVESGLANLSTKVADYLTEERRHDRENQQKVKDLTRQVRSMEAEATELRGEVKSKQDLATKDPLTNVYNRAGYEERVQEEFARRSRVGTPLSIIFVDCNKFKQINDTFGHNAGDVVLVKVAETLKKRARASDIVARYGGDEFIVLLPDTALSGAKIFAHGACESILAVGFNNNGQPLDVSISCGVTEVSDSDDPATALHRADQAMYEAKKMMGIRVFGV